MSQNRSSKAAPAARDSVIGLPREAQLARPLRLRGVATNVLTARSSRSRMPMSSSPLGARPSMRRTWVSLVHRARLSSPPAPNANLPSNVLELPLSRVQPSHQLTPQASLPLSSPPDLLSAALLGGIAGGVDAAGWFCLAGLLPSHLTASLVMLGARVTEYDAADVRARIAMLPVFVCAVAMVKWVARGLTARQLPVLPVLLTMLTTGLSLFTLAGSLSDDLLADDPHLLLGIGGLGVASMAVQNAIMRLSLPHLCPTTVMTGNLTQVVMSGVDMLARRQRGAAPGAERDARARLFAAGSPLLGFVLGSVACGLVASHWGLVCLVLPLAMSLATTVIAWRRWRSQQLPASAASGHGNALMFPIAIVSR
jgi:uncharacterized membrane protein YoaK (UPF0700 family)